MATAREDKSVVLFPQRKFSFMNVILCFSFENVSMHAAVYIIGRRRREERVLENEAAAVLCFLFATFSPSV